MTLPEQCAVLLDAFLRGLCKREDVVAWADRLIMNTDAAPDGVLDLSVPADRLRGDFVSILGAQAARELPLRRRVQIIMLAYDCGVIDFLDTAGRLSILLIDEQDTPPTEPDIKRMMDPRWDLFILWEQVDVRDPAKERRLEGRFGPFRTDREELRSIFQ